MADFLYGIASLGYLAFIFLVGELAALGLYLFFYGVVGRWVPYHWWEKLAAD